MSESVNLADVPQQLATGLGISLFAGQILSSLILMSFFLVPILILTRGKNVLLAVIVAVSSLVFATALNWMPSWILVMIMVLTGALMAGTFRDWITGKTGGGD